MARVSSPKNRGHVTRDFYFFVVVLSLQHDHPPDQVSARMDAGESATTVHRIRYTRPACCRYLTLLSMDRRFLRNMRLL